ncbi:hypothetical protein SISNIDRAFT_402984, partial [Sistotremastrum niveocremeum HHB9708]
GPAIPRRDSPDVYEEYCQITLLLFKPWRQPSDLIGGNQSFAEAFTEFSRSCSPRLLKIIDNIQLLNECRQARNE